MSDKLNDQKSELLRNYPGAGRLRGREAQLLEEWMSEPVGLQHAHYMIRRSNLEVLDRLEGDGLQGRIRLIQAVREIEAERCKAQRLLDEARTKLAETRAKVLEIALTLERPDDPWDEDDGSSEGED